MNATETPIPTGNHLPKLLPGLAPCEDGCCTRLVLVDQANNVSYETNVVEEGTEADFMARHEPSDFEGLMLAITARLN